MTKQKYLLIELSKKPRFWLTDEMPDERFLLDGIEYNDSGFGDFLGFYDYLRNFSGEILGIRFFPFEDCNFPEKEILFLLSENDEIDKKISDDQRFGENRIYQARNGSVLLTFPAPDENFVKGCKILHADFAETQLKAA